MNGEVTKSVKLNSECSELNYVIPKLSSISNSVKLEHHFSTLKNFVLQEGYPCIGAQTSINSKAFAIGLFSSMEGDGNIKKVGSGLYRYLREMTTRPNNYLTYVAVFEEDNFLNEESFENALWNLLSRLHRFDRFEHGWSKEVGSDPSKPDFAYSFGGRAFFIVGMHPKSSRKARRYTYPAIAFNLHSQFENLRNKGRYNRIKQLVRDSDMKFQGSINPMLQDFGDGLEAPQYSGRKVGPEWKCPFLTSK